MELSSGAIRNHRPDIMLKAFEIAGYARRARAAVRRHAERLPLGAPPHGGIAPGIDRIVMLLAARRASARSCLPAEPAGQDLMMNAPSEVSDKQLRELHIRLNLP